MADEQGPGLSQINLMEVDHAGWNAKVKRLAARLGVAPRQDNLGIFSMVLSAGDEKYDVIDLVNAFLDRLDTTTG